MKTKQLTPLDKKIKALKLEEAFKTKVKKELKKIDHLAFMTGHEDDEPRLVARCKDFKEALLVLKLYPPTNKKTVIGTAGDSYFATLKTPFHVKLDNPCSPSIHHSFQLELSYESNKVDVQIELSIDLFMDFVNCGERNITDSEYHYFTGVDYGRLRSMKVMCYNFKADKVINWYGGDKSLLDEQEIQKIIDSLMK